MGAMHPPPRPPASTRYPSHRDEYPTTPLAEPPFRQRPGASRDPGVTPDQLWTVSRLVIPLINIRFRTRSRLVPAIAEYPGTQIYDFFFFWLQIEGVAGALDCNVAAAFVVERLAQLAIGPGSLVIGNVATPKK
jgi:hypothetical protein